MSTCSNQSWVIVESGLSKHTLAADREENKESQAPTTTSPSEQPEERHMQLGSSEDIIEPPEQRHDNNASQAENMKPVAKDISTPRTFERALRMREPQSESAVLGVNEVLSPGAFGTALRMRDNEAPGVKLSIPKAFEADPERVTAHLSALSISSTFTDHEKGATQPEQASSSPDPDYDSPKGVPSAVVYNISVHARNIVTEFLDGYVGFLNRIPCALLLVDATSDDFSGSILTTLWWDKHGENDMKEVSKRHKRMYDGQMVRDHPIFLSLSKDHLIARSS